MFLRIEFQDQEPVDDVKRYSTGIYSGHFPPHLMKHHPVNTEYVFILAFNFLSKQQKSFFILWRIRKGVRRTGRDVLGQSSSLLVLRAVRDEIKFKFQGEDRTRTTYFRPFHGALNLNTEIRHENGISYFDKTLQLFNEPIY